MAKDTAFTDRMAKIMVAGAVFAAGIYAIDLGIARAASWWLVPAIVVGLLCVVIGEILSWHNAAMAWHERRAGSMALWGILALVCSVGTLYTNFSTSALNQDEKSAVQLTSFTAFDDMAKTERELTRKIDAIDEKLRLSPVETADAYSAKIENFKAHKFFKSTDGCKTTKGPQTRQFCSDYASAIAGKSNAGETMVLREDRKTAESELVKVRGERKTTKAVVSDDTPAIRLIGDMIGDKSAARQLDSMTFPLLVQAIMLFGGILLANEHARNMVKKPWIDWHRLAYRINWVLAALTFKPLPEFNASTVNHVTVNDDRAVSMLRAAALEMKAA